MWLRKGSDVTINSDNQHPSPPWRQGQGGVNPEDTKYGGWSSDGNAGAMAGIRPPEDRDPETRVSVEGVGSDSRRWRRTTISGSGA